MIDNAMRAHTRLSVPLMLLIANLAARAGDDGLFRERVAPVLERRCVHCHGESSPKGRLSLTTLQDVLRGGESGPAIELGKPDDSLLVEMISGTAPEMPQKDKPLSGQEVEAI